MGESLEPILKQTLGEQYKLINVSEKANIDTIDMKAFYKTEEELKKKDILKINKNNVKSAKSV